MYRGYFKFLKQSSNQHGVHSPFVFSLLTKGLYPKDRKWKGKKKNVFLARLVAYFKPNTICIPVADVDLYKQATSKVAHVYSDIDTVGLPIDFIVIESGATAAMVERYIKAMHNDSVLVLDRRDQVKATQQLWEAIVAHKSISVSIDFYSFGVAFVRKEQLKEHFVLRM